MNKAQIAVFTNSGLPNDLMNCEIPILKEGEVLVRNTCTCLCSSDLHTYFGRRKEKSPTILGHEITGIVEGLPKNELISDLNGQELKIGDRLTWAIFSSDPDTEIAKSGIPQKSSSLFKYGHEKLTEGNSLHGGLATHIILRKNTPKLIVHSDIPDNLLALVNCSVATVAGAVRLAGPMDGKKVLIVGAGMLGIMAIAMCHSLGAEVFSLDLNSRRIETAKDFGALPYEYSNKVDYVLEFSGSKEAMEAAVSYLEIGGVMVWVGATFPVGTVALNPEYMIRNLITIKGLHNYNEIDFKNALQFMISNYRNYPFSKLINNEFELNEVNEAFAFAENNKSYRVAINFYEKVKE